MSNGNVVAENLIPDAAELEMVRAVQILSRDPAAKARATQILREELRTATTAERNKIINAITLLERAAIRPH